MKSEVIIFDTESFYALIEEVLKRVTRKKEVEDIWIDEKRACQRLNIGKTRLWQLRNEGAIRFTQPTRKHILYDARSINEYLNNHAKEPF